MSDDPFPGSPDDMMDRLLAQETKIERLEDALAAMRERTIDECEAITKSERCVDDTGDWSDEAYNRACDDIADAISALRASPPPPSDEDLPTADDVRGILGPPTPSRVCPDCGVPMTDHGDDPFREGVRRWHCQRCDGWRLDTPVAALALVRKGEMSTAYEELLERCRKAYEDVLWGVFAGDPDAHEMQTTASNAFLSEVFRTLKNVTPEMDRAASGALQNYINGLTDEERAESGARKKGGCFVGPKTKHRERYLAMLRASPLAPPKEGK